MTTLPVSGTTALSEAPVIFPNFADGGGWSTEVVLVNPSDELQTGNLQFFSQGSANAEGAAIALTVNGTNASSFPYSIPPRSSAVFRRAIPTAASEWGLYVCFRPREPESGWACHLFLHKRRHYRFSSRCPRGRCRHGVPGVCQILRTNRPGRISSNRSCDCERRVRGHCQSGTLHFRRRTDWNAGVPQNPGHGSSYKIFKRDVPGAQ